MHYVQLIVDSDDCTEMDASYNKPVHHKYTMILVFNIQPVKQLVPNNLKFSLQISLRCATKTGESRQK